MIVHKTQMNANERKHANHKRKILLARPCDLRKKFTVS